MKKICVLFFILASCNSEVKERKNDPIKVENLKAVKRNYQFNSLLSGSNTMADSIYANHMQKPSVFDNIDSLRKWVVFNLSSDMIRSNNTSILFLGSYLLNSYGVTRVYQIKLSNELPTGWLNSFCLFYSDLKKEYFIIPFDKFEKFSLNGNNKEYLPAGFISFRHQDFFTIYKFNGRFFFKAFDSSSFGDTGVAVGYYDDDCISYTPKRLTFRGADLNNDGFSDLTFNGRIVNKCMPLTRGKNTHNIEKGINFIYIPKEDKWSLQDKSICIFFKRN